MELETHKRYVKGTGKWWEDFGTVYFEKDKISFRPDFIVKMSPEKQKELDCKYVWGERVLSRGGGMTTEKRVWLPKMLSREWLIVVHGRPGRKTGWEALRPETYEGVPPEDNYNEGIYGLLQCLKFPHFFRKELHLKNKGE